jgi:hypothetical protein
MGYLTKYEAAEKRKARLVVEGKDALRRTHTRQSAR